jgi:NAD(P)-dependent dehydrogenase (short-subunit alcohol dehydrogenase family)
MSLHNRTAIVTGAGRGIGLGIATALCQAGARVVIGEQVAERGEDAAAQLRAKGFDAVAIPLNITQPASCRTLVEQVCQHHGRIDILVNNAGLFALHPSEDMPEEAWRLQIDVMLNGTFFMTQAVARVMIAQQSGSIVSIASIGGMGGWPMRSAYNAAKAAVINLTETLAGEWAHYGIRVNAVSPGVTRTEMMADLIRRGISADKYANRTPLGRVAEVEEIASAVCFLASDRASYITGENLRVDGGWVPWANMNGLGFPEPDNK